MVSYTAILQWLIIVLAFNMDQPDGKPYGLALWTDYSAIVSAN